ncbi:MAG: glutathione S-transferase N-terminal domain-containing protein [Afipia sp.]|nr:glutathione S-transferase N-terminal domain-containing protein [Afipia sp.]
MSQLDLVLIGSGTSPFVRKVRIAAAQLSVPLMFRLESQWSAQSRIHESNPLSKVPVLLTPEFGALYDSRVIIADIERRAARVLRPEDPKLSILDQRLEALADGVSESTALTVQETWRPTEKRSTVWAERQRLKVQRGVDALAKDYASGLFGERATSIGSITAVCALDFVVFWMPDLLWQYKHAAFSDWFHAARADAAFVATRPALPKTPSFPQL